MYGYNDYGYGYDNWGWGWNGGNVVHGTVDQCGCIGGCMGSTYHNNVLKGSCARPVTFTKLERRCINGKEIDVLIADSEFFDRLRFDCTECRDFYASICCCIEFGDTRPVFLASPRRDGDDGCGCEKLIPLVTSRNGFMVHADMIQIFADSRKLLRLKNCYDPCNEHVTISNYQRKHVKCGCGCGCEDGHDGYGRDGFDGFDGGRY